MPQPDFFNINPDVPEEKSLDEKLSAERLEWTTKISEMNLKNIDDIPDLMINLYSERQRCVEYYHYLISKLIILNKEYRKRYAERYEFWSHKSQIRYPNESTKNNKILTELNDVILKRESIENHSKFMLETKNTLDNIIYAVKNRIDLEKIKRGSL